MFTITEHPVDAMTTTQIVLCGACGLAWEPGHVCPGYLPVTADTFCCVCGFYHDGVSCMGANLVTGKEQ